MTYQDTRQKVQRERKNVEHLASYTRRENRLAIVGRVIEEQRKDTVTGYEEGEEENAGLEPEKKMKFDLLSFI